MAATSQPQPRTPGEAGILAQHVPLGSLFSAFLRVGAGGWGGGSGTTYMMHQELVQRRWMTSGQFALDLGLVRIVPGINLLAMAVVAGYRLNGALGAIVCTLGLMLPASLITLVLTLAFAYLTANPIGEAMLKGAVPVAAALTFALAFETGAGAVPRRPPRVALLMIAYMLVTFVLVAVFHLSAAAMIIAGALVGACFFRSPEDEYP